MPSNEGPVIVADDWPPIKPEDWLILDAPEATAEVGAVGAELSIAEVTIGEFVDDKEVVKAEVATGAELDVTNVTAGDIVDDKDVIKAELAKFELVAKSVELPARLDENMFPVDADDAVPNVVKVVEEPGKEREEVANEKVLVELVKIAKLDVPEPWGIIVEAEADVARELGTVPWLVVAVGEGAPEVE